ncbi:MAG: 50S ribosomal protein L23 [Patescibacteria group bacterium]
MPALPFTIKKPWVSEKSTDLSKLGQYVFIVAPRTTKNEVKKAVEKIYGVKVINVNIINKKSKKKRLGRTVGLQQGHKKAIITLLKGQSIDTVPK